MPLPKSPIITVKVAVGNTYTNRAINAKLTELIQNIDTDSDLTVKSWGVSK
jgi:hypothetical protein